MIATAVENTKTAWLGEFPAHWEVLRIKNLFQEMGQPKRNRQRKIAFGFALHHFYGNAGLTRVMNICNSNADPTAKHRL